MKSCFLLLFCLGTLFQIQADVFTFERDNDSIYFPNRGDVRWFEFELYNSVDSQFSPLKIEIIYPEGIRPLNNRTWRGKPGLYPREFASKQENENKIVFNLANIQANGREKFSAAFVSLKRGKHFFETRVFVQDTEGIWVNSRDYSINEGNTDSTVKDTSIQALIVTNNNLFVDSTQILKGSTQIEDDSVVEYQIDYEIFKKYFYYLIISIIANLILLIVLIFFIIKTIHRKKTSIKKKKDLSENKIPEAVPEIVPTQIIPGIEFNPDFDSDRNNSELNFSSKDYNYLVELILDNEILKRKLKILNKKIPS